MQEETKDISEFESRLESVFKPVKPPDDFVRDLRKRLVEQLHTGQPQSKASTRQIFLLVVVGVLSFILMIATGIRAVLSLLVGMKYIFRSRKKE